MERKESGSAEGILYTVYRSNRKTCSIRITSEEQVEVRAPLWMSRQAIQAFVDSKAAWIQRHLTEMDAKNRQCERIGWDDGQVLPLLGKNRVVHIAAVGEPIFSDTEILLPSSYTGSRGALLESLYRQEAREYLKLRTAQIAKAEGLVYRQVKVNGAHGRWGSCSAGGNLNFSWLLILVAPDLIDYVILHELCHTIHMNHSGSFWREVERRMPDYGQRREKLRQEQITTMYLYKLVQNDKG